jgi:hypothetical protein
VIKHNEVRNKAVKRILKSGRFIFFEYKMPNPCKTIPAKRSKKKNPKILSYKREDSYENKSGSSNKMKISTNWITVFFQIIRIKFLERFKMDVFSHNYD